MSEKRKLIGRIVFAADSSKSQIYWKCPMRGCTQIHYFLYPLRTAGAIPIFQKTCDSCHQSYIASLLNVTGTSALLAAVFKETY